MNTHSTQSGIIHTPWTAFNTFFLLVSTLVPSSTSSLSTFRKTALVSTMEAWNMAHTDSMSPIFPGTLSRLLRRWELKLLLTRDFTRCSQQTQYISVCLDWLASSSTSGATSPTHCVKKTGSHMAHCSRVEVQATALCNKEVLEWLKWKKHWSCLWPCLSRGVGGASWEERTIRTWI